MKCAGTYSFNGNANIIITTLIIRIDKLLNDQWHYRNAGLGHKHIRSN